MVLLYCITLCRLTRQYEPDYFTLFSDLIVISISILFKKDFCPIHFAMKSFLHKDLIIRCLVVVFLWETLSAAKKWCVLCFWFVWNKQKKNCRQHSLCGRRDKGKERQLQKPKLHQKKIQKSTHSVWLTGDLWKCRVAAVSAEQQRWRQN